MMRCLIFLGNAILNFLILNVTVLSVGPHDTNYWIGVTMAFISGFGLRIMSDLRKDKFTFKSSSIQFFTSLFLCYAAFRLNEDFTPNIKIQYYVFFCALSSVYIADLLEKGIEMGLLKYVQLLLAKGSTILSTNSEQSKSVPSKRLKGGDKL